ncbi:MAG TPA: serine/threonine-protein kinase [Chlamydiales bacterium]|nr:serine/threonine-protein kinase [Chlamydiales bacterium]
MKEPEQRTIPTARNNDIKFLPDFVGPYKIESLFKKGGMSLLYLAKDPTTQKPIIVKILSPKFIKNKDVASRFLKEAKIISLSTHPNIIKLLGQGNWEKGLYIAMEFIQGISLHQFIHQKTLCETKALQIIIQVAYALSHLHSHQIIHRDLKPENILITESGDIKVIDFGIAQLIGEPEITPRMMGTPSYMSPEQKKDPKQVSFASDIYSLGIITYELLTGKLSHGQIHLELLDKQIKKIIKKATEPNQKKRYQNIVDFITDISEYLKFHEQSKQTSMQSQILCDFEKEANSLYPLTPPKWNILDIGFAKSFQNPLNVYLDFIHRLDNTYLILHAYTDSNSPQEMIHISTFKGVLHALLHEQKSKHLEIDQLLNSIHDVFKHFNYPKTFKITIALYNPKEETLSFSASGENLFFLVSNEKITEIKLSNSSFGDSNELVFDINNISFKSEDQFFLLGNNLIKEKNATTLKNLISDNLFFSPMIQTKKIIDKADIDYKSIVCIKRIF